MNNVIMMKKLSYILFNILLIFEKIIRFLINRSFIVHFSEFLQEVSNKKININQKTITLYAPNQLINWRIETLYTKEPETIEWINSFSKKKNIIFWDIGANIGLYSIYNSIKNKGSLTIAFEPSSSNLKILSRNISLNNLNHKIKIFSLPLTDRKSGFMTMKETLFQEGGSMNTFGEKFNYEGKKLNSQMNYDLFGVSIKYLLDNKLLEIPDYIKIDVDGIEHLILSGAGKYLRNKKIKSLSVEINENFKTQYERVIKIMKQQNFKIRHKKNNISSFNNSNKNFLNTFNYIFDRN